MKIFSLILLSFSAVLSGQFFSYRLCKRIRLLEQIILMLKMIETDIEFLRKPAEEIIKNLAEKSELCELDFLRKCNSFLNGNYDFRNSWEMALENNTNYLKKDDREILISFGRMFGVTDAKGQLSNCEAHIALAENKLKEAKTFRDKYSSLFCSMGALTGIGIFILLF